MKFKLRMQRAVLGLATAILALSVAPGVMAAKLVNQNLTQLIADSQTIIAGTVQNVSDGISPDGIPYTEVSIAISSTAKGAAKDQEVYTFRQFGLLEPRELENGRTYLGVTPEGFARWQEGETVMAFLHKPASMTGLQTTAGMAQGKLVLRNGYFMDEFDNAGLFEDVEIDRDLLTDAQRNMLANPGPAEAGALMDLVARAVAEGWIESGEMR
ncbi:MAG: hypothetical protein KGY49_13255 [Wenzhouxiangellaceae bacterium]|nr:hypothetical protein [Wenzhouxiangellaceae bacterium]